MRPHVLRCLAIAFCLVVWFGIALGLMWYSHRLPMHVNPCTANAGDCYSIQGENSHQGCPGQYKETVEVGDQIYFLSCFGTKETQ